MAPFGFNWNKKEETGGTPESSSAEPQQEAAGLKAKCEELESVVAAFMAENKVVKESQKEMEEKEAALNKQIEDLQKQVETLQKEIDDLKSKENELQERENALLNSSANTNADEGADASTPASVPTSDVTPQLEAVHAELGKLKELIGDVSYKDKLIKELHEELQKRNRDFLAELSKPYLKNIVKIFERLSGTYRVASRPEYKEKEQPFELLLRALESDKLMVEDMLNDEYDMECYEPAAGSPFVPREHTALQSLPTTDEQLGGTIVECRQQGFRDMNTGKIFKPAMVTVYKLEK